MYNLEFITHSQFSIYIIIYSCYYITVEKLYFYVASYMHTYVNVTLPELRLKFIDMVHTRCSTTATTQFPVYYTYVKLHLYYV